MDNCPYCDIFPVMCKCCGEVLSDIKHPVPDASNNYEWQNEFYANIGYDYAEHIPEIKDSVELFQNYIDKGMFAASQPAAGYSLQQVADAFEAGAENEYEKHFGAIPPLSLNKETYLASLQPAGNGWVSNNVDFDSPEMKLKIEKVKEEIKAVMDGAKIDTSKLHITFR